MEYDEEGWAVVLRDGKWGVVSWRGVAKYLLGRVGEDNVRMGRVSVVGVVGLGLPRDGVTVCGWIWGVIGEGSAYGGRFGG